MKTNGDTVSFEQCDMAFVKKFGIAEATDMVLNFKASNRLPFIYDTFQLAGFLGGGRKALFYYAKNADREYRPIVIKKKNGQPRKLYAPSSDLRLYQSKIRRHILAKLPVSAYATAYTKGSTLMNNVAPHVGKRYLLKLDITDFFGNIRFFQVYSAAFNTNYFPKQIGVMLTALCCREDVLPQGAPTSPALSNLVMRNFDNSIGKWCDNHGISYTRYCDDMTFSSDRPLFAVCQKVRSMLEETGFELNEKKTRFVTNAMRQSVTGLTVNEKVSVSSDYKRKLRQEVHYALKFGLSDSIKHANMIEFIDDNEPDEDRYLSHLIGKLNFVLHIEPDNQWFKNALEKVKKKFDVLYQLSEEATEGENGNERIRR